MQHLFPITDAESSHLIHAVPEGKYLPVRLSPGGALIDAEDPGAAWAVAELLTLRSAAVVRQADDVRRIATELAQKELDEVCANADKLSPQDLQSRAYDLGTSIARALSTPANTVAVVR